MTSVRSTVVAIVSLCIVAVLPACDNSHSHSGAGDASSSKSGGGSPSGGGLSGVFTSVDQAEITIEFKSGSAVTFSMGEDMTAQGTYTIDGEKVIVTIDNQKTTFTRDGNCIEDDLQVFGKMCKGGKAGADANVSTRNVPTAPEGTWVATNEDGEFKIEFKPDSKLTMTMTPTVGRAETLEGKFTIEGDKFYVTLDPGKSMVLKFVNNTFESSAFGLPMKFVRQ